MVQNPPANMPRITPYLLYEDVESALTWLSKAFGFRERLRFPGPEGKLTHAEMEFDDGVILIGDYEQVIIQHCTFDPGGVRADGTPIPSLPLIIEASTKL